MTDYETIEILTNEIFKLKNEIRLELGTAHKELANLLAIDYCNNCDVPILKKDMRKLMIDFCASTYSVNGVIPTDERNVVALMDEKKILKEKIEELENELEKEQKAFLKLNETIKQHLQDKEESEKIINEHNEEIIILKESHKKEMDSLKESFDKNKTVSKDSSNEMISKDSHDEIIAILKQNHNADLFKLAKVHQDELGNYKTTAENSSTEMDNLNNIVSMYEEEICCLKKKLDDKDSQYNKRLPLLRDELKTNANSTPLNSNSESEKLFLKISMMELEKEKLLKRLAAQDYYVQKFSKISIQNEKLIEEKRLLQNRLDKQMATSNTIQNNSFLSFIN
uniref:GRIP domain-containing protein n=1 Tax=Rhabditophanes sp. KR3021 TaxID=114890 RepID=A0AC35TJV8_9BILA